MKYLKTFEGIHEQNLYFSIRTKNIKEVRKILKQFNVDINSKTLSGDTPLISAVEKYFIDGVKILIKAGANLNLTNNIKRTALFYAAFYKYINIVDILIDAGADWNIKDDANNEDFLEQLDKEDIDIIIKKYPEKYKKYLIKKQADKFNL